VGDEKSPKNPPEIEHQPPTNSRTLGGKLQPSPAKRPKSFMTLSLRRYKNKGLGKVKGRAAANDTWIANKVNSDRSPSCRTKTDLIVGCATTFGKATRTKTSSREIAPTSWPSASTDIDKLNKGDSACRKRPCVIAENGTSDKASTR
jgi:hypothetical protein